MRNVCVWPEGTRADVRDPVGYRGYSRPEMLTVSSSARDPDRRDRSVRQIAAPTGLASCLPPSRHGLDTPMPAATTARRPAVTAPRHKAKDEPRSGRTNGLPGRTKKLDGDRSRRLAFEHPTGPGVVPLTPDCRNQELTTDVLQKPEPGRRVGSFVSTPVLGELHHHDAMV